MRLPALHVRLQCWCALITAGCLSLGLTAQLCAQEATPKEGAKPGSATSASETDPSKSSSPTAPNIEPIDFAATAAAQTSTTPTAAAPGDAWNFVTFSPDGNAIATVSSSEGEGSKTLVIIWNTKDSSVRCQYEQPGRIQTVAFSPDGTLLAIGPQGPQYGVVLIDSKTGTPKEKLPGPAAKTNCIAWSSDGKRLALGCSFDKSVRVWNVASKKFERAFEVDLGSILSVTFSSDGTILAAGTPQRDSDGLTIVDVSSGNVLKSLKGHKDSVESATFTSDASRLVSGGFDATIRIWNVSTGEEVAALKGHKRGVRSVTVSNKGNRIASSNDREFKLWDGEKNELIGDIGGEATGAKLVSLSSDGSLMVSISRDGLATVWDVEMKSEKARLSKSGNAIASTETPANDGTDQPAAPPPTDAPEPEAIQSLAYSLDGKWLAIAREDGRISIRTAKDGKIHKELEAFGDVASCVAFSPDSRLLAAGSFDKSIKIWKVESGEQTAELVGHTNWVFSVAWSNDGALLASAGYDKTARVWNVAEAKEVKSLGGHTAGVRAVAFTKDNLHLITGSADRSAIVWKLADYQEVARLKGHAAAIRAIACSPDGATIATASEDGTAKLWKTSDWTERATAKGTDGVMFWCLAFSPQGRTLAAGAFDGTVKLFDPSDGKERATLRGPTDAVTSVAFAPDAHEIIAGSIDKSFRRWSAQRTSATTGETKAPELKASEAVTALNATTLAVDEEISSLAFDKEGKRLAVGTGLYRKAGSLQLWDVAKHERMWKSEPFTFGLPAVQFSNDGQRIMVGNFADNFLKLFSAANGKKEKELRGHRSKVHGIAFDPKGKTFATASLDRDIKLWDASTLKEIKTFLGHKDFVFSVAYSPDGTKLLTASADQTVRIWSIDTTKELMQLKGHSKQIQQAVYSRDGSLIATAGGDGISRVYEASTGNYLFTLRGQRYKLDAVAFSPNGKLLATGSADGSVRLWDASCGAEILKLTQEKGVRALAFSPDGKLLASGCDDKTVKLWDVTLLSKQD